MNSSSESLGSPVCGASGRLSKVARAAATLDRSTPSRWVRALWQVAVAHDGARIALTM